MIQSQAIRLSTPASSRPRVRSSPLAHPLPSLPSDPNAAASVDATGLIVTIALNAQFVDDPANPMSVTYTASGIIPNPATAPTSITATIQPTVPALTPTAITFQQTT